MEFKRGLNLTLWSIAVKVRLQSSNPGSSIYESSDFGIVTYVSINLSPYMSKVHVNIPLSESCFKVK